MAFVASIVSRVNIAIALAPSSLSIAAVSPTRHPLPSSCPCAVHCRCAPLSITVESSLPLSLSHRHHAFHHSHHHTLNRRHCHRVAVAPLIAVAIDAVTSQLLSPLLLQLGLPLPSPSLPLCHHGAFHRRRRRTGHCHHCRCYSRRVVHCHHTFHCRCRCTDHHRRPHCCRRCAFHHHCPHCHCVAVALFITVPIASPSCCPLPPSLVDCCLLCQLFHL